MVWGRGVEGERWCGGGGRMERGWSGVGGLDGEGLVIHAIILNSIGDA